MVAGWESFTSAGGQQRVYRRQRGSSCSFSTDTSSTPTALHGSVPLGSAAANIALALALALREPPPAGTLAVHRHAMITHPQKTSWSSLMQAEGYQINCISAVAAASWIVANMFHAPPRCSAHGLAHGPVRLSCQIIKRGSNSGSFSACSSWRAASGSGDVLCRCWAG
jgi:hypothetical protein